MYVQVNIGRNVTTKVLSFDGNSASYIDEPMPQGMWENFIETIRACVAISCNGDVSRGVTEVHRGIGEWNGKKEESAHISIFHEPGIDLETLRKLLRIMRDTFRQESIALVTHSTLI